MQDLILAVALGFKDYTIHALGQSWNFFFKV